MKVPNLNFYSWVNGVVLAIGYGEALPVKLFVDNGPLDMWWLLRSWRLSSRETDKKNLIRSSVSFIWLREDAHVNYLYSHTRDKTKLAAQTVNSTNQNSRGYICILLYTDVSLWRVGWLCMLILLSISRCISESSHHSNHLNISASKNTDPLGL
jgi:hypothetical protein